MNSTHPPSSHKDGRVSDLISRMTLDEKISFLTPRHPAIDRLNISEYRVYGEAAHGLVLREGGEATVFPQPIGLSMTWNKKLMKEIGSIIGDEARAYFLKRKDGPEKERPLILLFPTIDMERDPRWGRNEEAYGEDPFLAGRLATALIKGVQGEDEQHLKAAVCTKHFYANNYELERAHCDSVISDERLKYEYYLRVFAYAFEEGRAVSLMTAYNKINGVPGMINPEMNSIVREKWGADGFFVTDGGAFMLLQMAHKAFETDAQAAAAAINAGIDCFLDNPEMVVGAVSEAVAQGLLSEADIDRALHRQLRTLFRLGIFDEDGDNPYNKISPGVICCAKHAEKAKQAALESVTLLKNDGILPLDTAAIKKISVTGILGGENMPDWYSGNPPYQVTVLEGIKKAFPHSDVAYCDGCDIIAFYNEPEDTWLRVLPDGTASFEADESTRSTFKAQDWGFGGFGFKCCESNLFLTTTPEGRLMCNAETLWGWFTRELFFLEDGIIENGRFTAEKRQAIGARSHIEMGGNISIYDKPYEDGCVEKINEVLSKLTVRLLESGAGKAAEAAKGADAAVVVLGNHSLIGARECVDRSTLEMPAGWARLLESVCNANGNTILALICGYPFACGSQEDMSRAVIYTAHGAQEAGTAIGETLSGKNNPAGRLSMTWYNQDYPLPDINDYDIVKNKMTYLYCDKPVLHEFGFGLSYTAFGYEGLAVKESGGDVSIEFTLTNTGKADGDEVVQVYFTHPDTLPVRPLKQLAGFERIKLAAGESKRVHILVPRKELQYYDTQKGMFCTAGGEYAFGIGASSADIRLRGTIELQI